MVMISCEPSWYDMNADFVSAIIYKSSSQDGALMWWFMWLGAIEAT